MAYTIQYLCKVLIYSLYNKKKKHILSHFRSEICIHFNLTPSLIIILNFEWGDTNQSIIDFDE